MNRKKVILKPIQVSDSDREFSNTVLASNKSPLTKNIAVPKIDGGYRSAHGAIALLGLHNSTLQDSM